MTQARSIFITLTQWYTFDSFRFIQALCTPHMIRYVIIFTIHFDILLKVRIPFLFKSECFYIYLSRYMNGKHHKLRCLEIYICHDCALTQHSNKPLLKEYRPLRPTYQYAQIVKPRLLNKTPQKICFLHQSTLPHLPITLQDQYNHCSDDYK